METPPKDGEPPKVMTTPSKKGKRKFIFEPPHEAPIFTPTSEEFEDPLKYISEIRPLAETYGICKIIPPPDWKPPFALNFDTFKFTPRIQRINELEAKTRIKLNFLDQIAKFWAIQGSPLKIPTVGRSALDLYTLHRHVIDEGGPEKVTKDKKWNEISTRMGFPGRGSILRGHYDHIIYPFYLFQKENLSNNSDSSKDQVNVQGDGQDASSDKCDSVNTNPKVMKVRELKSLQFLGAGPKMAVCSINSRDSVKPRTRGKKVLYNFDPLAKYICKNCCNDDLDEALVTCERCDDKYHTSCVIPPLVNVISEGWKCPKCVAAEVCKPLEEFGFAQAQREYSLKQFGEMADKFKSDYFKTPCTSVPTSVVENEFWRVVSSIDEAVTVEYGADLHTVEHGSGFPKRNSEIPGVDWKDIRKYSESDWNLNNFPVLKASALRHISADISGMKIPWVYVGMCFATFCWHNEDHWSYSINYLHWGEPKTWYGVPGMCAEDFEKSMKSAAPELFESQPDLLHQLVTTMNPNVAMSAGVPVCRTDQKSGEFVVTFPRAYHAGFNQGYNFAEACNFAPSDWLKIGRECISHYSSLRRYCVFSHDELLCKMAEIYNDLDERTLLATYKDFYTMLMEEKQKRRGLLNIGVSQSVREKFDCMIDDERQCSYCKTTCFLSALHCSCNESRLVCLDHYENLCECSPTNFVLRYHYRLDELVDKFITVKHNAENFDNWLERVNNSFIRKDLRLGLRGFCELLSESKEKEFPRTDLIDYLEYSVRQCMEYAAVARILVNRILGKDPKKNKQNPTVEELNKFLEEIEALPCIISEANSIKTILTSAKKFTSIANKLIANNIYNKKRLEACINLGKVLRLEFEELPILEERYKAAKWCEDCKEFMSINDYSEYSELKHLFDTMPSVDNVKCINNQKRDLTSLMNCTTKWQNKVNEMLQLAVTNLDELEFVLLEGANIKIILPERVKLAQVVEGLKIWTDRTQKIINGQTVLSLPDLEALLSEGKNMPNNTKLLSDLEYHTRCAKEWKMELDELFLKPGCSSLFDVLWPRKFISRKIHFNNNKGSKGFDKPLVEDTACRFDVPTFLDHENLEMQSLMELRSRNMKTNSDRGLENRVCVCGKVIKYDLQCFLCKTSFHSYCMFRNNQKTLVHKFGLFPKVLCWYCVRTKRPSYDRVISLLKASEKLVVKIVDVIILKHIVKRIHNWLKIAREILRRPTIKTGLDTILSNVKRTRQKLNEKIENPFRIMPETQNEGDFHNIYSEIPNISDSCSKTYTTFDSKSSEPVSNDSSPTLGTESDITPQWLDIYRHVKLSQNDILEMKLIIMEGDVLEVMLQETTQLWLLLQITKLRYKSQLQPPLIEIEDSSTKNIIKREPRRKCSARTSELFTKSNTPLKRPSVASRSPPQRNKRVKFSRLKEHLDDSNEIDEEPEVCAASSCLKPSDVEVDWVQCDGKCGLWFHMRCVDLMKQDITEEDEYICLQCLSCDSHGTDEVEIPLEPTDTNEVDPLL